MTTGSESRPPASVKDSEVKIAQPKSPDGDGGWRELFRYANGKWLPADGTPDVAFGGKSERGYPYAVAAHTKRWEHDDPANRAQARAMEWVCGRYGCANGRRVHAKSGRYAR